ncbi:hypothetical protein [Rhodococcus gordoniae]|uniref:hypothetical protein n=1 Tax=Rhodococcus gordoniae TaxID=223392 RepID=UPI0035257471
MPWFKVDDGLAFHPKAIAAGNSAMGLWVRAGAWCSAHLTEGALPKHMIGTLGAQNRHARRLVEVGLWEATDVGYQFIDWDDYQPTKQQVEADREANRERQKRFREKKRNAVTNADSHDVSDGATNDTPTRPDPTRPSSSGYLEGVSHVSDARENEPPPFSKCPRHINEPNPPACRACGEARQARSDWEARKARESSRARSAEAHARAQDRRRAIDDCRLCDGEGYIGTDLCAHALTPSSRPSLRDLYQQAKAEEKTP